MDRRANVQIVTDDLRQFRTTHHRTRLGDLATVDFLTRRFRDAGLQPVNGGAFERKGVGASGSAISYFSLSIDGDSTLLVPGFDYIADPASGSGTSEASVLRAPGSSAAGILLVSMPDVGFTCAQFAGPTIIVVTELAGLGGSPTGSCDSPIIRITRSALQRSLGIPSVTDEFLRGMRDSAALPFNLKLSVQRADSRGEGWSIIGLVSGADPVLRSEVVVVFAHMNDLTNLGDVTIGTHPPAEDAIGSVVELALNYSNRNKLLPAANRSIVFAVLQQSGLQPVDLDWIQSAAVWSETSVVGAVHLSSGIPDQVEPGIRVVSRSKIGLSARLIPGPKRRGNFRNTPEARDLDTWFEEVEFSTSLTEFVNRATEVIDSLLVLP